ncbi:NADH-dependent flavin oxidoreductase [Roseomonas sp. 18066]|uniref:NADH-dependent flavin oxidoreductase n=1 Tax=Roseomonas sp. 18066 TaxID=2681412 RepID=UPI001357BFEE|nr:NADH-dependent flavin oxidoreductase [Roseomonas sp. 18066]
MASTETALFGTAPFAKGLTLRNRIVMAPMTTWSGNEDGTVSAEEEDYYRRRVNGVGLVITGCTHVALNGIGFTGEFAAYDDRFVPSLKRLAAAARSGGAPAILQIFHAGNKAVPSLVPGGDIVSASTVTTAAGPFSPPITPRALSEEEILHVVRAFGETTRRAIEAGFDGVELHGAHGFLIQNFLSPHFNRRDDAWGGSLENRMRFPLAVVEAVRQAIAAHADRPFVLGYRISPEESNEGGLRIADSLVLVDRLVEAGIDYLHGSLPDAAQARPVGHDDGPTVTRILSERLAGRAPLVVAGQVRMPGQAQAVLHDGADLVAVGQGLVMNPDWVELARSERSAEIETAIAAPDAPRLGIPRKLWAVIEATPGWFAVK